VCIFIYIDIDIDVLQEGATPGELSAWVLLGSQLMMVVYIDR